jgi:2,4-dienoyl-CoA reductase-like NADH-dependent reductase (Old Yellow Enzyme family)
VSTSPASFSPLTLRGLEIPNRVWASPMCQYSADGAGTPVDWHLVHLGQLALGGAGLVITEATAVEPDGRISPWDTGLWCDAHVEAWERITRFVRGQGVRIGVQLSHAGRKASTAAPWDGGGIVSSGTGGWETMGPSPIGFGSLPAPREMTEADLTMVRNAFVDSTKRAVAAGFDLIELHAAHGYLLHQFLSPLSNHRNDAYGGDWDGRIRLLLEVVEGVRAAWPEDRPLLVRVSATDWAPEDEQGWTLDDTVALAPLLAERGVDLIDCSTGGNIARPSIPLRPGYQVPFASAVRAKTGIPTGAVGLITEPSEAEAILAEGDADAVLLARALLAEPTWPRRAAAELGGEVRWPQQYLRARARS